MPERNTGMREILNQTDEEFEKIICANKKLHKKRKKYFLEFEKEKSQNYLST